MSAADAILARLAARQGVTARVMIVVTHPDDETIGMGAQLCRFANALLVHATDGAPRDGRDARNYGFASVMDYAAARHEELAAALHAGGADRMRTLGLDMPDQETVRDLPGLTGRIAELLRFEQPEAVFTHAYEGGHPDHDAAAFAAHSAGRLIDSPPALIEIPLYHRHGTRFVTGHFLDSHSRRKPGLRVLSIKLEEDEIRRKRRMIDCFATQRWLLEQFDPATERFRIAPDYDFLEPPHPGALHYETLGWEMTGADWRRAAADALDRLGIVNKGRHCEEHSDEAISAGPARLLRSARNDN